MPEPTPLVDRELYVPALRGGLPCPDTTFTTVTKYEEYDVFTSYDEPPKMVKDVYIVHDKETGDVLLLEGESEYKAFRELDTGVYEFSKLQIMSQAIDKIHSLLPEGQVRDGFTIAAVSKVTDLVQAVKEVRLGKRSDVDVEQAYRGLRELGHAFSAIESALMLGQTYGSSDLNSHVWFKKGGKNGRLKDGYTSLYETCYDSYQDEGDLDYAPNLDEVLHYPGLLQISVDPNKRIEFAYTPASSSARAAHHSDAMTRDTEGREAIFSNDSLSIRLDLDTDAPAGIALVIGRSAYDGIREGKYLRRPGDLLGDLLSKVSSNDSHEYRGFTLAMRDEFRTFAEWMVVGQAQQTSQLQARTLGKIARQG